MKNSLKLFLICLPGFILVRCSSSEVEEAKPNLPENPTSVLSKSSQKSFKVGDFTGNTITITYPFDSAEKVYETFLEDTLGYVNAVLDSFYIVDPDISTSDSAFLMVLGTVDSTDGTTFSINLGTLLDKDMGTGNYIVAGGAQSFSCKGDNCERCRYLPFFGCSCQRKADPDKESACIHTRSGGIGELGTGLTLLVGIWALFHPQ